MALRVLQKLFFYFLCFMKLKIANKMKSPRITEAEIDRKQHAVGKLIVTIMKEQELSIERLAYDSGISRSQINKYRNGQDLFMSTLLKLIHALGMTPFAFFSRLNKMKE